MSWQKWKPRIDVKSPLMSQPAVLIATSKLRPGQEDAFAAWQIQHNKAVAKFPGYISSDIMPPIKPGDNEWTTILNFQTPDLLLNWQKSEERARVIGDVLPLLEGGNLGEIMPEDNSAEQPGTNVTQVILSKIKPGMEDTYREWSVRIQQAQGKYPGYRGTYLQPPSSNQDGHWTTMLRYDTSEHLEAWLAAPERAELLRESKAFIENEELMRLRSSFPGWVPINPITGEGPPNWKTAMLVVLGLYPTVLLELRFLNPHLASLNPSLATFIGNVGSVAITTFITMPLFVRWFGWWLFTDKKSSKSRGTLGLTLLIALFVIEIALLWRLLL
jgi:antibiotic biosynthesis monooxygenase (ABM) superfamily enzyme